MSQKEFSEKNVLEALKALNSTISTSFNFQEIGKQTFYAPLYFDTKSLNAVVDLFMSNRHISDNYMPRDVEKIVGSQMVEFHERHEQNFEGITKTLMEKLLNSKPEIMNVFMPVHGVSISAGRKISLGCFTFMAQDVYDALGIVGWSPMVVNLVKETSSDRTPIVMVPVYASEPDKAREKAIEEFQWLENAIRFFMAPDIGDFGIITYSVSRIENSIVTQANGVLRGAKTQLKGFPIQMPLEQLLVEESIPFKIIAALSDTTKVLTEYQKRIRHAMYLGGLAVHETVPSISFFLAVAALEALFQVETDKYVSASIANQILEAFCYLTVDTEHRRAAFEDLKTIYRKRSAIAHGGKTEILEKDARVVRFFLQHAIVKLSTDPELAKIQTAQAMSNLIKDLKFGKIQT